MGSEAAIESCEQTPLTTSATSTHSYNTNTSDSNLESNQISTMEAVRNRRSKLFHLGLCLMAAAGCGYLLYLVVEDITVCENAWEICQLGNMTFVDEQCPPSAQQCKRLGDYDWCTLFCQNAVQEVAKLACRCRRDPGDGP